MSRELSDRIEVSPMAKRALDIEAAVFGSKQKELASMLILTGVSQRSRDLANEALKVKEFSDVDTALVNSRSGDVINISPDTRVTALGKPYDLPNSSKPIIEDVPTQEYIKHLRAEKKSVRYIAKILGRPRSTVGDYIKVKGI